MGLYVLTGKCLSNLLSSLFSLFYIILPPSLLLHSYSLFPTFFYAGFVISTSSLSLFLSFIDLFPFLPIFSFSDSFPFPSQGPLAFPLLLLLHSIFHSYFLSSAFYLSTMVELNTKLLADEKASSHKLTKFRPENLISKTDFVRGPEGLIFLFFIHLRYLGQ